jgi:PAS domain S-box-containing protein
VYCEDCAPFQMRDRNGNPAGIVIDFWNEWRAATGREIEWVAAPWSETLAALRNGTVDAHAGLFRTEDREPFVDYGPEFLTTHTRAFFHRELPVPDEPSGLRGLRVGVLSGDASETYARTTLGLNLVEAFPRYPDLVEAGRSGDLRVIVADTESALYHLSQAGLDAAFPLDNSLALYSSDWHVGVPEGRSDVLRTVSTGFQAFSPEARRAITRRWSGGERGADDNTLVVSLWRDYAPYSYLSPDGEPIGLLVDLWRRWSAETGRAVRFHTTSWPGTLFAMREGIADIHSGIFMSEDRRQWLEFSTPLHLQRTALIGRSRDPAPTLTGMRERRVAVILGSFQESYLRTNHPAIRTVPFDKAETAHLALLRGEVDALAEELSISDVVLARLGYAGLARRGEVFLSNGVHAAVRRGDTELLTLIESGFNRIPVEELAEIEGRWLPNPDDHYYATTNFQLTDQERAWLAERAPLGVAVTNFIDPIDIFTDEGRYTGFNADLLDLLRDRLGVEIVPRVFSRWPDLVTAAKDGDVDLALSMSITEDREPFLFFTDEYANDPLILVGAVGNADIGDFTDLPGKTVGLLRSVAFGPAIAGFIGETGTMVPFETDLDGLRALEAGEIDVYATSLVMFGASQRRELVPGLQVRASLRSEGGALRIAVPKDREPLYEILSRALHSISPTTRAALRERWLEPPSVEARSELTLEGITGSGGLVEDDDETSRRIIYAVIALLVGLAIAALVLRRLTKIRLDALQGSQGIVGLVAAMIVVVLGATVVATSLTLDVLERQTRQSVAESLRSTLQGRVAHLTSWIEAGIHQAELLASTNALITAMTGSSDDAHLLVDRSGLITVRGDIQGVPPRVDETVLETVLAALALEEALYVPPRRDFVELSDRFRSGAFLAPVRGVGGRPRGAVLLPAADLDALSEILTLGQLFESGETYAFDAEANLVSRSRFREDLVLAGLIQEGENEILAVRITDPGASLIESPDIATPESDRPPTRMAASAISGQSGSYIENSGYRDYLGEPVLGVWLWSDRYGFGVTTEVDVDEALGPFRRASTIVLALVGGVVIVGLALTAFSVWMGRTATRSLRLANQELEDRVAERTKEAVESEERARSIVENAVDGILVINQTGIIQSFSPAAETIFGYSADEVLGKNVDMLMPTAMAARHGGFMTRYLETGESKLIGTNRQLEGLRKDGTIFPMDLAVGESILADERVFTGIVRDITERKAYEDRLEAAEEQNRLVLESVGDGIFGTNTEGQVNFVNSRALELLGYEQDEIIGVKIHALIHHSREDGSHYPIEECPMWSAYTHGTTSRIDDEVLWRKDGTSFPVEYAATPITRGTKTIGCVVTFRDITDRREAEDRLANAEAQLRMALESMQGGLILVDADLRLQVFNDRLRQYYDLPSELIQPNAPFEAVIRFRAERGDYGPGDPEELTAQRLEGYHLASSVVVDDVLRSGRIIETNRTPTDNGGTVVVFNDVTQRRTAEAEIEAAHALVTDSIRYASRIQQALLPKPELLHRLCADHFVIWEPRDVVGGDMYWIREDRRGYFCALFDCTGHGVPGALMTTIAASALNVAFTETGDPARLLARANQYVKAALDQRRGTEGLSDDGLEMGICLIEPDRQRVTFAGARFDLIHGHGQDFDVIKGDKAGLGYRSIPSDRRYTNHTIRLRPGVRFYLYSDGISDQIGGPNRRAFGRKRLMETIARTANLPMPLQGKEIMETYDAWQGDETRRDDVSMLGFIPIR